MSSLRPDPAPRAAPAQECGADVAGNGSLPPPPVNDADALLGGGNLALITLGAQTYQLRLTGHGTLILNTQGPEMIVCQCLAITDHDIRAADPDTLVTAGKVYRAPRKSADCGGCMSLFVETMRQSADFAVQGGAGAPPVLRRRAGGTPNPQCSSNIQDITENPVPGLDGRARSA